MVINNNPVEIALDTQKFIFLLLTIIFTSLLNAQEIEVRDIQVFTEEDSVIILYSFEGELNEEYEIKLFILSIGNHFNKYETKPESVKGDINKLKYTGNEGRIVWTPFGLEWLRYFDNDIKFEIIVQKVSSRIPWYYYVGGAVAATITAILVIFDRSGDAEKEISTFAEPPVRPQNP